MAKREFMMWNATTSSWEHNGGWTGDVADADTPIMRHNYASDALVVRLRLYTEGFTHETADDAGRADFTLLTVPNYIPHTGGIRVFKRETSSNFKQLTVNVDYVESLIPNGSGGSETLSDTILFRTPITETDAISVVYVTSELLDGIHYNIINSNIVQIVDQQLLDRSIFPSVNNVSVWGLSTDEDSQNPARLVDKISHTSITPIQIWDPARDDHYTNAIHNIDLQNSQDPARYTNTPQTQQRLSDQVYAIEPWTDRFVGTTWLSTVDMAYFPYYDTHVYPETEARLRLWGQLNDWGEIRAYEWVKSNVPPDAWDALAATEEGDVTIPEGDRKSGTAKKTLFVDDGTQNGVWLEMHPTLEEFDVVIEGFDNDDGTYTFTTTAFADDEVADVYVSGKLVEQDHDFSLSFDVTVEATVFDRVSIRKHIPSDPEVIADGVDIGIYSEEYQYVQIDKRDEFGNEFNEYFFWVQHKGTKATSKGRTDNLRNVVTNLKNIPVPYMFFQELKPPTSVEIEGNQLLSRIEQHTTTNGQTSIVTELPIAPNTTVVVVVDGIPIPTSDITYVDGERVVTFTNHAQPGDQLMEVVYTGLYDETVHLPSRHVQMVSRGLRGIVDADRRYVLQYTRDFTLRDDLNTGKTPLEKKNLHSEWEMFRQHQPYHVNRVLWDKITESIVGYQLADETIRVPSFERELYDDKYDTSTQYGIGDGQAFVNGGMAQASVLADLENPDNNFQPIDINVFFSRHSFDTVEGVVAAMDTIYNTYSHVHVNRIFFSVLQDAMSSQAQYADIMKTSMVSLHGIRPFQLAGIFDD